MVDKGNPKVGEQITEEVVGSVDNESTLSDISSGFLESEILEDLEGERQNDILELGEDDSKQGTSKLLCTITASSRNLLNAILSCFNQKSKDFYSKNIVFIDTSKSESSLFFLHYNASDLKITEIPVQFIDKLYEKENFRLVFGVSEEFIKSIEKRLALEKEDIDVLVMFYDNYITIKVKESQYEFQVSIEEDTYDSYLQSFEDTNYISVPVDIGVLEKFIQMVTMEKEFDGVFLTSYIIVQKQDNKVKLYGGNRSFINTIELPATDELNETHDILMLFKGSILDDITDYDKCSLLYSKEKNITKLQYNKNDFSFTGYYTNVSMGEMLYNIIEIMKSDASDEDIIFEINSESYEIFDFVSKISKETHKVFNITKHSNTSVEINVKGLYNNNISLKERVLAIVRQDFNFSVTKNIIENLAKLMKNMKNNVLSFYNVKDKKFIIIKSYDAVNHYKFKAIFSTISL